MGVNRDSEKGATVVEFAIVAPVLIIFIFLGIDMLYLCYRAVSLQYAVNTVFRETIVGEPESAAAGYQHDFAMVDRIKTLSRSFGMELQDSEIEICSSASLDSNGLCFGPDQTGTGGELIVININHQTNVLFLDSFNLRATAIGRNEPF